jgi:hypothetical protein
MARDVAFWHQRGATAASADAAVRKAFQSGLRDADPAGYAALLATFHACISEALPSCDPTFLDGLAAANAQTVDAAIAFLEADPWFFRSGYEKQALIRHLKRIPLSVKQRERLSRVVVAVVDSRDRTEFRHYCRLACTVWSDWLDAEIAARMTNPDAGIRRRATWVAEAAIAATKA